MLQNSYNEEPYPPGTLLHSPGLATRSHGEAFELKYQLNPVQAAAIEAWARIHLKPDCHGQDGAYRVTSLYCDTANFDVFHRKPGFKRRKYRVRRYGQSTTLFLERKTKSNDAVRKKRVEIADCDIERLAAPTPHTDWSGAWFHERVLRRNLLPAVRVSYERTAFFGCVGDSPVRLTLDRHLVGAPANEWRVGAVESGIDLLPEMVLLEMKFHVHMPQLFQDLLPQLPADRARVSKYRRCVHLCGLAEPVILPGPHEIRVAAS